MNIKFIHWYYLLLFFSSFLISSCITVRSTYHSQEKFEKLYLQKKQVTFRILENKNGERLGELSSPLLYKAKLIGSLDESDDTIVFTINKIKYFANWHNGWTEGTSIAYGKLKFVRDTGSVICYSIDPFEIWETIDGAIRLRNDYYFDVEGKKKVKNRIDRIISLVNFLKIQKLEKFYAHPVRNTDYGISFKNATVDLLFPEYKGFQRFEKKHILPKIYYQNFDKQDATGDREMSPWKLGFGIWWNSDYTKTVFPEALWDVRNSGSLWLDYEQALGLFFMFYNMDYFFNELLNETVFIKMK